MAMFYHGDRPPNEHFLVKAYLDSLLDIFLYLTTETLSLFGTAVDLAKGFGVTFFPAGLGPVPKLIM